MKQKWIAGLLVIGMLAAMGGCSGSDSSSDAASESASSAAESNAEETEESAEESATEEMVAESSSSSDSEFAVEILSTSISTDYEGSPVLVVEYNFTNNSDEAASFIFSCQDKAFQNGVECSSTVIGCDEIDSEQTMNDIQPGVTYALKTGYMLQDTTTPVDIEVTSLDILNEETLLQQTVNLQ